ncbi:uncharacterized protein STEHIDRAFT_159638 [Stereum hirsutum FP-91666 SS1]|uniref:uncharacterized protein n=1 Tax=Stereum hirsutum (strain FP-91666) TaxID=721885 RepID=UPI0004449F7C|nr:uncharacterized protein STEHIDRAFT_159638 [Stereum hirsutum FP-91666 SS1]EIM84035.1 hypothetical protein STEHIDRAFT_159638 [Stereum hirsutum FP-91666 SS1]
MPPAPVELLALMSDLSILEKTVPEGEAASEVENVHEYWTRLKRILVRFRDLNIVNAGVSHMLDNTRARRESLILELPNNRALLEEFGEWLSTGPPLPLLPFTEMATKQLCIDFHAFTWAGFGLWVGDDIHRMETLEDGCLGEGFVTSCASRFQWPEGCSEAQRSEVIQFVRTRSCAGATDFATAHSLSVPDFTSSQLLPSASDVPNAKAPGKVRGTHQNVKPADTTANDPAPGRKPRAAVKKGPSAKSEDAKQPELTKSPTACQNCVKRKVDCVYSPGKIASSIDNRVACQACFHAKEAKCLLVEDHRVVGVAPSVPRPRKIVPAPPELPSSRASTPSVTELAEDPEPSRATRAAAKRKVSFNVASTSGAKRTKVVPPTEFYPAPESELAARKSARWMLYREVLRQGHLVAIQEEQLKCARQAEQKALEMLRIEDEAIANMEEMSCLVDE